MYKYEVWVGGIVDYEGNSIERAIIIAKEYLSQGYTDTQIQIIDTNNEAIASVKFN